MKTPLISVIIPVYKVEDFLDDCIRSVVCQTYKNLEIILVDDGSPDSCPQMCDKYTEKDSRIIVIHKSNGGLSDARNAGLNVATGEYIAFLDSDDYVAEEMYEHLLQRMLVGDCDIVASNIYAVKDGIVTPYDTNGIQIKKDNTTLSGYSYLKMIIGGRIENASWNKLYKRECFSTTRFKVGRNNEDFLMFYDLCQKISCIAFIDYFGYYYRQREGSIVHDPNKFLYYDIIANIEEIKNDIIEKDSDLKDEIYKKEIQERIIFMKTVLKRHKLWANKKAYLQNRLILLKTNNKKRHLLEKNFQRPFLVVKYIPFVYWL